MRRTLPFTLAAVLLAGCPKSAPKDAQLHVSCAGQNLDGTTEAPEQGQACPAGSQVALSYDNSGGYGYVTVFAVTRDNIVFYLPSSDTGDSVAIQPSGSHVALPGDFTVPAKTRDIVAIFSREPLHAKDVAQHTRDVTLSQLPGAEIVVKLSREHGPID